MCPGGGGGSSYSNTGSQPNFGQQQQQINSANDAKAEQDQQDQLYRDRAGAATSDAAKSWIPSYFNNAGLPYSSGLAGSIIGDMSKNVPDLDPNPDKYFTQDAFNAWMGNYNTMQRQSMNNQVQNKFQPGFDTRLLPNTSIDPIISSILGEQQGVAQQQLDFNKSRGLLNDQGYNAAETALGQQASAGKSTLTDIGNSVLGTDRQGLTDIYGQAGDAASRFAYGQKAPDVNTYWKQAKDLAGQDATNLEGSVRGAVGSTNLFDVPTLLQKAGISQGPINLTTSIAGQGNGASFGPVPKKGNTNRGLGSTGVF